MTKPAGPPEFPRHDPASAAFWDVRFEADFTPWDQGGVPQALVDYVKRNPEPRRTLIPGCGSAWEVRFLHQQNWPVTAIDFSAAAVASAQKALGPLCQHVRIADFFGAELARERFDVIYERAFMCALPVRLRPAWAERIAELLVPGSKLIGFFYFDESARGPPFGISPAALASLLTPNFALLEECVPADSIPVFAGKENWQVWQRRQPEKTG